MSKTYLTSAKKKEDEEVKESEKKEAAKQKNQEVQTAKKEAELQKIKEKQESAKIEKEKSTKEKTTSAHSAKAVSSENTASDIRAEQRAIEEKKKQYQVAQASKDQKQTNVRNLAEQVNYNQSRQKIATGTPTLEGDRYTAPNKSFMTRYESAEDYLESDEGDQLAKGLINRFRSVPGEVVEDIAYLISDVAPGYKPAQNVVETNTAGQIAALADQQLANAKENTGDIGNFLIDATDAGTRMLSNATFFGKRNIAASQAVGSGLAEYRGQREQGTGKTEALFRGVATGAGSYFLERLGGIGGKQSKNILAAVVPGTKILDTKKAASLITQVVKDAAEEGGEEFAESVLATGIDFIADAVFRDEITIEFDLMDALRNAGIGAILGAGYAGGNITTAKAADSYYNTPTTPTAQEAVQSSTEPIVPQVENVTPVVQNATEAPFASEVRQVQDVPTAVQENVQEIAPQTEQNVQDIIPQEQNAQEVANTQPVAQVPLMDRIVQLAQEGRTAEDIKNIISREYDIASVETETPVRAQNDAVETPDEVIGAQTVVTEPQTPATYAQTITPDVQGTMGVDTSTALNRPAAMISRADMRQDVDRFHQQTVNNRERNLSQFVTNTVPKSPLGTDETLQYIKENNEKFTYAVTTDRSSIEYSKNFLEKYGVDGAINHWKDIVEGKARYDKDNGVLAGTTIRYLVEQGRSDEANKMLAELQAEITISAQATQGAETIQKILEPAMFNLGTNSEHYVQILTDKLNEKYDKRLKRKIHYNEQLVQEAISASGTDAEGKAWDKVYVDIANQVPLSFWERAIKIRYFCMLSNPRTDIRNISGNVANVGLKAIKDGNKALVEGIVRKANQKTSERAIKQKDISEDFFQKAKEVKESGNVKFSEYEKKAENAKKKSERLEKLSEQNIRTVNNLLAIDKSTWDYAYADYENAANIYDKGNKYDTRNGSFVTKYRKGNRLVDAKSKALSAEDNFFKRITYTSTLAQEMAANGITPEMANDPKYARQMSEMQKRAFEEARYVTYNQDSRIADWIAKAPEEARAAITAFQPFLKVPINIVKEGYHYSPLGMFKGFYDISQAFSGNSDVDINTAINEVARGMTGVELAAIGMLLRHLGKITNGLSDDEDDSAYRKLQGEQAFSWKLDDGSTYSIDWIGAPVMPIFTGAMLYDNFFDESFKEKMKGNLLTATASVLLATATSIADPMLSMSMLQNVESLLSRQYDDLEDFLTEGLGDFALSFVPQFVASVTKVVDNTKRNAYFVDKTDNIPDNLQIPFQAAKSRIPGLSQTLPEKVDAWGRTETHSDRETFVGRFFDAFISPGTYKTSKTTEADRFLMDVFGGAKNVLPKKQESKFTATLEKEDVYGNKESQKETVMLSNEQYVEFQKEYGTTAQKLITELSKDKEFRSLPYDTQKGIIDDIYSYAQNAAKEKIYKKYHENPGSDFEYKENNLVEDANAAKEDGLSYSKFFISKKKYNELGTIKTSETDSTSVAEQFIDYLNEATFTEKEKLVALEHIGGVDTDKYVKAMGSDKKAVDLYEIMADDDPKATDLEQIKRKFKVDDFEAREIYAKASGDWNNSVKDVVENGQNRQEKVDAFKKRDWSDKDIVKGYNALIGIGSSKKDVQIEALTRAFGSKKKATEFYNIKEGNKGYK